MKRLTTISIAAALGLSCGAAAAFAESKPWVGLSGRNAQTFVEQTQGVHGPAIDDLFGYSLAAGDFNGDGVDDLATGIPGDECGAEQFIDCGSVQVRLGFRVLGGLVPGSGVFVLAADNGGIPTASEAWDRFGYALASGDFNGDGYDDLAVGQPDAGNDTGSVDVHYGFDGGIELVADENLRPGVAGLPAAVAQSFNFGGALAAGNFNCDLYEDLAIGFRGESFAVPGGTAQGGSVFVANGGNGGLLPYDGYRIAQGEPSIPDDPESIDHFGEAVAAGDFNGDGCDDLAIGVPNEDGAGAVLILFGNPNGLLFANHYWLGAFDLGTGITGDDRLGAALAVGNFDGDAFDDLVLGVPGRDNVVNGFADIGMIGVLYGATGSPLFGGGGFNFAAFQWIWEDLLPAENGLPGDAFGAALAAGDFTGDGYDDLAVGTPGNASGGPDTGQVTILLGGADRLNTARAKPFWPGVGGFPGPASAQTDYQMGAVLAAGDFDGNGQADLALGMPRLNTVGRDDGGEFVLYGYLFLDGFEGGVAQGLDSWSSAVP